jgi:hypothetical protein
MREAVKFAKSNNFLGLICQTKLLVGSLNLFLMIVESSCVGSEYKGRWACLSDLWFRE